MPCSAEKQSNTLSLWTFRDDKSKSGKYLHCVLAIGKRDNWHKLLQRLFWIDSQGLLTVVELSVILYTIVYHVLHLRSFLLCNILLFRILFNKLSHLVVYFFKEKKLKKCLYCLSSNAHNLWHFFLKIFIPLIPWKISGVWSLLAHHTHCSF